MLRMNCNVVVGFIGVEQQSDYLEKKVYDKSIVLINKY